MHMGKLHRREDCGIKNTWLDIGRKVSVMILMMGIDAPGLKRYFLGFKT